MQHEIWPGQPYPLGATYDGVGTNFALFSEVAERVGLSSSPCWRRIKRLEDAGVIQRRVTILDREKLGLEEKLPEVVSAHLRDVEAQPAHEVNGQTMPAAIPGTGARTDAQA